MAGAAASVDAVYGAGFLKRLRKAKVLTDTRYPHQPDGVGKNSFGSSFREFGEGS